MTLKQIYKYIFLIIVLVVFIGCKNTRWVEGGDYLLMDNEIYINNKKVNREELRNILKQQPNRQLTRLWRPYLSLYNMGNPNKEKGLSHWFTKIGEAPVIADSTTALTSARQLGIYTFGLGFFNNTTEISARRDSSKKKIWMRYDIYTGAPYYFGNLDYLIASESIDTLVKDNRNEALIKPGEQYDASVIEKERVRLVKIFRNNGYYGFQKELIRFEADTMGGHYNVNMKMIISDQPIYYKDSTYYRGHSPDTIKLIYIDPSYSYINKNAVKDTIFIDNYAILTHEEDKFDPQLIIDAVHFEPGDQYNEKVILDSYEHITSLRVFRSSEILFQKSPENLHDLKATIRLKPFPKRSITLDLEGTTTSGNVGILGSVSVLNRNLFKRGEIFDITFRGGIEAQANLSSADDSQDPIFNTYEYSVEFGVNFPRFVMPKKWQRKFSKKILPKTRISTSVGNQHRQEFDRLFFNVGLGYFWKKSETISMSWQLIDFNYLNVDADSEYLASLEFTQNYESVLISATRYTFTFNNQKVSKDKNSSFFMGSFELSGNLLNLIDHARGDPEKQGSYFGVEYAQYFKINLDYRNYTRINSNHHIVWRAFAGYTHTYGNTKGLPPFEKSFFAGGSNDVRGWYAYKLGPGNFSKENYNYNDGDSTFIYSATGPIKLMFNIEYRFSIIGNFKGAAFIDFGNIWIYDRDYGGSDIPQSELEDLIFSFKKISEQIAISPGLGLRYDFGFFVFRLDAAYKLYDPSSTEGNRFTPDPIKFGTLTYNLAIGYPF